MAELIQDKSIYVGIFGLPGSGKSTLARILSRKLMEKGIDTQIYKMSNWIKMHISTRGLPITKENVIQIGLEMKKKYGENYWAELVVRDLLRTKVKVKIIETGTYFREMQLIKSKFGKKVYLLFVNTPANIIFNRIRNRTLVDREEAERLYVQRVLHEYDVTELSKMADLSICNMGTLDELCRRSAIIVENILLLNMRL